MNGKKLFYWHGHNFGDELNILLFERLFGVKFTPCNNVYKAEYIAIGSIINLFFAPFYNKRQRIIRKIKRMIQTISCFRKKTNKVIVLGSSFNYKPPETIRFLREMDFKIVRGRLSEQILRKNRYITENVLLGDLGLLISYMYKGNKEKKYSLGIIPHFTDLNSPVIFEIYKKFAPHCIIINVQDNPEDIINQIAACENIISSSLHGLIAADSFNIPNLWFENRLRYPILEHFRYDDYYSAFDIIDMSPVQAFDFLNCDLDYIKHSYRMNRDKIKSKQEELHNYLQNFIKSVE
jgi:hypothetical protein